jgi:hypothetical protein
MTRNARHSLSQVFAMPFVLGVLSLIGLLSALIGDGIWDGLSWATLAFPVWILVRHLRRRA